MQPRRGHDIPYSTRAKGESLEERGEGRHRAHTHRSASQAPELYTSTGEVNGKQADMFR